VLKNFQTTIYGSLSESQHAGLQRYVEKIGDCSFLAALQAVLNSDPNFIKSMFVHNPNNTYSVRFFHNGVANWVTVDNHVPEKGSHASTASWVSLAERANVAFEATYMNDVNSYSSLPGNYSKLQEISGDTYTVYITLHHAVISRVYR